MLRVARYTLAYVCNRAATPEQAVSLPVAGSELEATLFGRMQPERAPWVVLHGLTVAGRRHPSLVRFARALAMTGTAVLVPDVPAWRELRVSPRSTAPVLAGAVRLLAKRFGLTQGVGVVGFSFGATQALVAAARPELRSQVRAVVGFAAYADVRRICHYLITGEDLAGAGSHQLPPDPYGRWILAGNYLHAVPGCEEMDQLRTGLHRLALTAGREGIPSWDARMTPRITALRATLRPAEREIFDLLAPPEAGSPPDHAAAARLADQLGAAALRVDPILDPRLHVSALRARVTLLHGAEDRISPPAETLALAALLPSAAEARALVTRLFAHSGHGTPLPLPQRAGEAWRFARTLKRALNSA